MDTSSGEHSRPWNENGGLKAPLFSVWISENKRNFPKPKMVKNWENNWNYTVDNSDEMHVSSCETMAASLIVTYPEAHRCKRGALKISIKVCGYIFVGGIKTKL